MTSKEGIFLGSPPCLADVTEAKEKIEILIARKILNSKLFYDMLLGFRVLEEALQHKQSEAYELVITWVRLFLKIQSNITNQNDGIRKQFEKVVPTAVTYIIGCLQYKAKVQISYHYQLLEMIHELLLNLRPGVLEKLATFETGVIACVWFPIGFVGDFNTQLLALRLLAMLLKCVDSTRLQSELNTIRCADRSVLKDKLTAAIAVANFQTAKFENTARDLLNTYNMHLAQNILVYSFRCKSFKLENNIHFFKPLNVDNFWIDFNYCPRTLSFNGRCQTNTKAIYANCSASLKVTKLSLNNLTLTVQFQAPAQIIKESGDLLDISQITSAKIIIPKDEAMRLLENKFILKYFNESHLPNVHNRISSFVKPLNISAKLSSTEIIEKAIGSKTELTSFDISTSEDRNAYPNIENKENNSPKEGVTMKNGPHTSINQSENTKSGTTNKKASSKQFQKSYEILIGLPKSKNDKTNEKSKVSNTKIEAANSIEKTNFQLPHLPNLEKEFEHGLPKNTRSRSSQRKIVNYSTSTSESQTSLQRPKISADENVKQQRKRFFKTQNSNSDSDYIPNKTKRLSGLRHSRNTKQKKSNISINKRKKINEVKPMLNSNHELRNFDANANTSHIAEEANANLNGNLPSTSLVEQLSNLSTNVYENLTVSDAEPGQSYRNFRIRRNPFDDENANKEVKRPRNSLPRNIKKKGQLVGTNLVTPPTKSAVKKTLDPFDAAKDLKDIQPKIQNPEKAVLKNKNQSVCSADIGICSSTQENLTDAVVRKCTLHNTETLNENKAMKLNKNETNKYRISKSCVQMLEKAPNTDVPAIDAQLNEDQTEDIQNCRQDVSQNGFNNVCDYDEFSDFPTFSTLLDISDMSFPPERESNKELAYKTTQQTGINLILPTKPKSPARIDLANKLETKKSIIYCSRSENDSDSEQSVISHNNNRELSLTQPLEMPLQQHVFLTPQLPLQNFRKTTSVTKCQITTTGTSVITQQDSFIHHRKFVVNLAASTNTPLNLSKSSSRATATTTTKTMVEEKNEVSVNSHIQRNGNFTAPTPKVLLEESADMITAYKNNLNLYLDQIETSIGSNSANVYIEKICDIGESMINEIERERKSLWELEINAERLVRQIGWQYEAYQRKHQQFQCFKQNIDDLLRILSNINLSEEIEYDAKHKIEKLLQTSNFITSQEWRNFVNESTENLLKDISSLSNL